MSQIGKAKTVGELKAILENIEDNKLWYGWDDGSLFIVNEDEVTEEGYIDNRDSE